MIKLSIIIVNWNTAKLLSNCLKSLEFEFRSAKSADETEIIVVDNGSTDDSVLEIENSKIVTAVGGIPPESGKNLRLKIIQNDSNLGFAKGNNIGIKEARGEYIMLLNSDTIIKTGAILKMLTFLNDREEMSIVGPRLLNPDGTSQPNCGRFPNLWVTFVMLFKEHFGGSDLVRCSPACSGRVEWLMGAAFMARKKVFDKIGGLDEEFFMYMEEVEWFYRSKLAGFITYFLKEAEIVHLGRGSSKSGKREPILQIYEGLLRFYKKHRSKTELALLKLMLKTKAAMALFAGYLKKDQYLVETYGQAIKIC